MPDKWEQYAVQPQNNGGADKWAQYVQSATPPPDSRNDIQKSFDSNTQTSPSDPLLETGLKAIVGAVGSPFIHPLTTAESFTPHNALEAVLGPAATPGRQLYDFGKGAVADYKEGGLPYAATKAAGNLAGGQALGGAVGGGLDATAALRDLRPSPSPSIVSPEEMAARNVAKTVLPPGGIKPEFLTSLQSELPAVKAYAARTGNPLNTQIEGLKASQGVAQEGLDHYKNQILAPAKGTPVTFEPGQTELGTKATIGDIDSRITKLNHMIDTSKASSGGQTLDVLAKSKFEDELETLRSALYSNLSRESGIPAESIQQLREGYGGEFSLANAIEAADNARLTRTGQRSQGQETINLKPPTLLDLPSRFLTTMRGGEQAIADRQFSRALKPISPVEPSLPGPPPIPEPLRPLLESQNRDMATKEVLNAHDLEQQAQAASDARASRAAEARQGRKDTADAERKLEGEAARTIGRDKARKGGK